MKIVSCSEKKTRGIAKRLAQTVAHTKSRKHALVFGLTGELGSGKTLFVKAFAKSLGITRRITSPSFLITREYEIQLQNFTSFFHVDAYRLNTPKELLVLNFKTIVDNPHHIVVVEWAEKIRSLLPIDTCWILFRHGKKENERIIDISNTNLH